MARVKRNSERDDWKQVAVLTMTVSFEACDFVAHAQELVESARCYGWPKEATIKFTKETEIDLLK